ncbi:MAG: hypothetical protein P9L99_17105 [Candidatus Lernaella stagnicola]|nr:hypothetical protein [Candidatus Lernaella stagnicola]
MNENPPRSGVSFYFGLAVVTAATLALEIIQTRLLSVVTWYHLAFFVISMAMFGMTAGALRVYLAPEKFSPDNAPRALSRASLIAAVAMVLSYLDQITLAPDAIASPTTVIVFARLALTLSIPFYFSGIAVTLALTRTHYRIGLVYGADLVGAAAGVLLVLPMFRLLDGGGAVFASAALMAVGAWLFARWGGERKLARWAGRAAAVMVILAIANAATIHSFDPILVKGVTEKRRRVAYEKWNSFSRVVAYKPRTKPLTGVLWEAGKNTPKDASMEVMDMNIDGLAGTMLPKANAETARGFLYDATSLAYSVRQGKVAVIGVGGGKDIWTALAAGADDVLGVEINPSFVHILLDVFPDFANLAGNPKVRLVVDEARSYFTRSEEKFDVIQMSLIDTWAATGAGAFSLSENSLYTVEGWRVFLRRLNKGGVFTVSRWYGKGKFDETARLISLAAGALFNQGVTNPADHILLAGGEKVATILVSNEAFSAADVAALRQRVEEMGFHMILAPGEPTQEAIIGRIIGARNYEELVDITSAYPLDLTPPTDDRPFFFNLLRLTRPWKIMEYWGRPSGVVTGNLLATLTLLSILLVSFVFAGAILLIPLKYAPAGVSRPRTVELAYFALIGLGFMFAEIAFLQRLSVYLGHPVYALAVVLFSLILFTGLGSLLSEKIPLNTSPRMIAYALSLAGYLALVAFFLPEITGATAAAKLAGRVGVSLLLLAPAGLAMGQAFPSGMRLARRDATDPTPWLWGVNGAAGVFASVLAVILSIAFGITTTMFVGAFCYASLALLAPKLVGKS